MSNSERFYKINSLLKSKRAVSMQDFLDELEVSTATIKRDIEYLRDRLNAPIIWDRDLRGYRYDNSGSGSPKYELPGLWFNASEIYALLIMEHLLENLQPGLLTPHIEPMRTQIRALMEKGDHPSEEIIRRIRLLPLASREYDIDSFEIISAGLLSRKRLAITHYNRERNESLDREVSPQRLAHYRDNWYLDTWCHLRNGLRTFSLETIKRAEIVEKKAKEISEKKLDSHLTSGYGIFSGKSDKVATLRFTPKRARWVSHETWHPAQNTHFDTNEYYIMEIPYSDERELVMDILKYGSEVEVLNPKSLRTNISEQLEAALSIYQQGSTKNIDI